MCEITASLRGTVSAQRALPQAGSFIAPKWTWLQLVRYSVIFFAILYYSALFYAEDLARLSDLKERPRQFSTLVAPLPRDEAIFAVP
jgi:hypothetical protein